MTPEETLVHPSKRETDQDRTREERLTQRTFGRGVQTTYVERKSLSDSGPKGP